LHIGFHACHALLIGENSASYQAYLLLADDAIVWMDCLSQFIAVQAVLDVRENFQYSSVNYIDRYSYQEQVEGLAR